MIRIPSTPVFPDSSLPAHEGPAGVRRDETRERLGRLRTELARIRPLPDTAGAAREAILMAMARAGLTSWSLPALDEAATLAYRDGSRRFALISHAIIRKRSINPLLRG